MFPPVVPQTLPTAAAFARVSVKKFPRTGETPFLVWYAFTALTVAGPKLVKLLIGKDADMGSVRSLLKKKPNCEVVIVGWLTSLREVQQFLSTILTARLTPDLKGATHPHLFSDQ